MANYNPPTEDITSFNTLLFNQPEVQLSQAEADLLYLSKVSTDISTAGSTTFNGQVSVGGSLVVSGNTTNTLATSGISSNYTSFAGLTTATQHSFIAYNNTNLPRTSLQISYSAVQVDNLALFNARQIKSTTPSSAGTHSLFDNMGSGGTLSIGSATSTNTINGATSFTNTLTLNSILNFNDTFSPFTNNTQFSQDVLIFNIKNNMTNGTIVLKALNSGGNTKNGLTVSGASVDVLDELPLKVRQIQSSSTGAGHTLFDNMGSGGALTIGGAASTTALRGDTTFNQNAICNNRLNWGSTLYTFPFASSQSLGYYLKATGTGTTVVSATPTTILTTASIPIGVWRIDFSVINVVGAAGAGTITQAQSYVSTTNNGAVSTAVDFTGSVVRSHVSEVYGNNDVQEINGSFTYQQSTAGALYLNIVRSFSTGTYLFTGEVAITRLA